MPLPHTTYQTLKIFVKHLPVAGVPTSVSELHPPSPIGNEKPRIGDVRNRRAQTVSVVGRKTRNYLKRKSKRCLAHSATAKAERVQHCALQAHPSVQAPGQEEELWR